jgi:two-component system phosphate regulon sensor histidine kinase PhoR
MKSKKQEVRSMRHEKIIAFFQLAFRSAGLASFLIGLIAGVAAFFLFTVSIVYAIIGGLCILIVSFVIIYTIIYQLHYRRIERLRKIIRNIARKQFEDYEKSEQHKDELGDLINESIFANKTIEREIQRLNRIENYRKEFIGDLAHELKTPIFAIQGFIETLLDGAMEDPQVNRKFLEKALRNAGRLTYLTQDLMEISKLETGELKSDIQHIYLYDVVGEVIESLRFKVNQKNIELNFAPFNKNILVQADQNQIKQALINLVENAMKYNKPEGSIMVGAKHYGPNRDCMLVYVKDTGIGIEPQYIDRVTERFFRIDKSRSREQGGTGLGLAIVKHIMEAHGQEFFIQSQPEVGSTFSFTLQKVERTAISV